MLYIVKRVHKNIFDHYQMIKINHWLPCLKQQAFVAWLNILQSYLARIDPVTSSSPL